MQQQKMLVGNPPTVRESLQLKTKHVKSHLVPYYPEVQTNCHKAISHCHYSCASKCPRYQISIIRVSQQQGQVFGGCLPLVLSGSSTSLQVFYDYPRSAEASSDHSLFLTHTTCPSLYQGWKRSIRLCFASVTIHSKYRTGRFFGSLQIYFSDAKGLSSYATKIKTKTCDNYWWNLSSAGTRSQVLGQPYSLPNIQSSCPGTSYHTAFSRIFSTQYKVSGSQQSCFCQFVFCILVAANKVVLDY